MWCAHRLKRSLCSRRPSCRCRSKDLDVLLTGEFLSKGLDMGIWVQPFWFFFPEYLQFSIFRLFLRDEKSPIKIVFFWDLTLKNSRTPSQPWFTYSPELMFTGKCSGPLQFIIKEPILGFWGFQKKRSLWSIDNSSPIPIVSGLVQSEKLSVQPALASLPNLLVNLSRPWNHHGFLVKDLVLWGSRAKGGIGIPWRVLPQVFQESFCWGWHHNDLVEP